MQNPINFLKNQLTAVKGKFGKRALEISDVAGGAINPFILGGMGLQPARAFQDWFVSNLTEDASIRWSQQQLRAYSRDLVRTNVYIKRYKSILANQIIGDTGITLHVNAREPDGTADYFANQQIEACWNTWGQTGNCTVDGGVSLLDALKLIVQTLAIDGEIFIRMFNTGDFGFSLQFLEADFCPVSHNGMFEGNRVINGIEFDDMTRPIAYWLYDEHPGSMPDSTKSSALTRVPADSVLHLYFKERGSQTRGIPWTAPAIPSIRILDRYTNAELMSSWASSCLMGTIETAVGSPAPVAPYQGTTKLPADKKLSGMEIGPMSINQLPAGKTLKWNSPGHPSTQYQMFVKTILGGIAASLNISYTTLAFDLSAANYSSMRAGLLDERQHFQTVQNYLIEHLLDVIYPKWLKQQILNGNLNLPMAKFWKFNSPQWHPRRWSWVDPAKDAQGIQLQLALGLVSRTEICGEQGRDFETVIQNLAKEQDLLDKYGVQLPSIKPTQLAKEQEQIEAGQDPNAQEEPKQLQ
ncbi:MAG: phage portal protein [Legionellales bacterium]